MIFTMFFRLDREKKMRIINTAMNEFAQKGFKNASTDEIVKAAEISKGSLYHYFKSKKNLYLFLYDYALNILKDEILSKFDSNERDIFIRRHHGMILKTEVLKKHPEIYAFTAAAYKEDSPEVKNELESRNAQLMRIGQSFLNQNIDTSKFKEGIDIGKAINIVTWTIDGFTKSELEKIKNRTPDEIDLDKLLEEIKEYLKILKACFYK
ncbi:TetR/AcrR family transcriptional regulator [Desulfosporosinus sp. SB140]|uniref:TetR/AcrR family transcriptional regulator n=1 Tax=Desulfosporosinus paludis TaxID=3115649 RepID=UPI00388FBD1E